MGLYNMGLYKMGLFKYVLILAAFVTLPLAGDADASNSTRQTVHVERIISPGGTECFGQRFKGIHTAFL